MSTHENQFPLKIHQFCILTFQFSWVNHSDICFSMQKINYYQQKIPYLIELSKNWKDEKYRWKPFWRVTLPTRLQCVLKWPLWILGTTRTIFILLQVSFQLGMVRRRMNQDLNIKKYFQEPILRKIPFSKNLLHTQHFVAYATRKWCIRNICCICNILLHMQHAFVAYATFCCICNIYCICIICLLHMQQNVAYAT